MSNVNTDGFVAWAISASSPVPAGIEWTSRYVLDLRAAFEAGAAAERERLCAAIKAADDKAIEGDYMLDSDDCISVIRGTWKFTP